MLQIYHRNAKSCCKPKIAKKLSGHITEKLVSHRLNHSRKHHRLVSMTRCLLVSDVKDHPIYQQVGAVQKREEKKEGLTPTPPLDVGLRPNTLNQGLRQGEEVGPAVGLPRHESTPVPPE